MNRRAYAGVMLGLLLIASVAVAQDRKEEPAPFAASPEIPDGLVPPRDYVIGPDDTLRVVFWREDDLTSEVVVRPDGRISLPLLNDVQAAGLTPEDLRVQVTEAARRFVADPVVSVLVTDIKSRQVFITGQVAASGAYPLKDRTTVMQLIAMAGGVLEFANRDRIIVLRRERDREVSFRFNYDHVLKGRNLLQNIELRPGDTVVVP